MSNILPYVNIFPSAPSTLFSTSLHHPALRHSVLSISALIADKKSGKGRERALEHLQKSLKLLQNSLLAVEVDEGVAISIFLLAYFNVSSGEHSAARKHLEGLRMVLAQLERNHLTKNGGIPSPYAISPLTMLVWRMAIRMDFILAIMYGRRPIFPMYFIEMFVLIVELRKTKRNFIGGGLYVSLIEINDQQLQNGLLLGLLWIILCIEHVTYRRMPLSFVGHKQTRMRLIGKFKHGWIHYLKRTENGDNGRLYGRQMIWNDKANSSQHSPILQQIYPSTCQQLYPPINLTLPVDKRCNSWNTHE